MRNSRSPDVITLLKNWPKLSSSRRKTGSSKHHRQQHTRETRLRRPTSSPQTEELSRAIRSWYHVTLIFKNMDPYLHSGTRQARAQYIEWKFRFMNAAQFTDVALHRDNAKEAVAVVTEHRGRIVSRESSPRSTTQTEEVANVLATQEGTK